LREIVELAVESYLKAPEGQRRTAKAEVSVVKAAVAEVVKEGAARDEWLDEPVEVVPPPVVRVAAPRLSHVLKGCKRCGHAAEAHGAFSCIKGCDCGGYVT
jgi:hypothetical protein